jgi:ribonuclease HI
MYFDGALNLEGADTDVLLISPRGEQLKCVLQIHYKASNNGAEYEALTHGLRIAVPLASSDYWLLAILRSSSSKSTRSGNALRFVNSKATSRGSSFSMSRETTTSPLTYFLN